MPIAIEAVHHSGGQQKEWPADWREGVQRPGQPAATVLLAQPSTPTAFPLASLSRGPLRSVPLLLACSTLTGWRLEPMPGSPWRAHPRGKVKPSLLPNPMCRLPNLGMNDPLDQGQSGRAVPSQQLPQGL